MPSQREIDEAKKLLADGQVSTNSDIARLQGRIADGVLVTPSRDTSEYGTFVPASPNQPSGSMTGSQAQAWLLVQVVSWLWKNLGLPTSWAGWGRFVLVLTGAAMVLLGLAAMGADVLYLTLRYFDQKPIEPQAVPGFALAAVGGILLVFLARLCFRLAARLKGRV